MIPGPLDAPDARSSRSRDDLASDRIGSLGGTETGTTTAPILIIEDDPAVRSAVRLLLEDDGFAVREAADGPTGTAAARAHPPLLVLLDLRLPGMHGFEVCRTIRQESDVPIIVVSAQADSHDVVAALEMGADDYVTKPFVARELLARIRATLRRCRANVASAPAGTASPTLVCGDLEVRPSEGTASLAGEALTLTKTEFQLLCTLAEHPNQVLSREQLLDRVWGYEYLGDSRLVDAHIGRLRAKIEPDPGSPRRLVTLRGLGYKLVA